MYEVSCLWELSDELALVTSNVLVGADTMSA